MGPTLALALTLTVIAPTFWSCLICSYSPPRFRGCAPRPYRRAFRGKSRNRHARTRPSSQPSREPADVRKVRHDEGVYDRKEDERHSDGLIY